MTQKKVIFLIAIIISLSFILNGIINYYVVEKNVETQNEIALKAQLISVESIIELNLLEATRKIGHDMKVAHKLFYSNNKLKETQEKITFKAINQITKETKDVSVKKWYLNGKQLHFDYKFVDELQGLIGTTVTIFQKIDGGFARISTNVMNEDSSRAICTYIPDESPVIKTITKGEQYKGRAYVVNDWYLTVYEPIWVNDTIKGILYVGVKEKEFENLKKTLSSIKIGKTGYVALLDDDGKAILHPTHEGEDFRNHAVFKEASKEEIKILRYDFEGHNKVASVKYYEPFHWYILITMNKNETFENFLISVQFFTFLFSVLLSIMLMYLITRIFRSHAAVVQKQQSLLQVKNLELQSINNTKDKLFSIISHDLKNPFNALIGLTTLIINKYSTMSEEKRLSLINQIHKSSVKNFELLENLLQWSKTQLKRIHLKKSKFDLNALVRYITEEQIHVSEHKKITLVNNVPEMFYIYADENLMQVVLRNLISNAIKYSYLNSEIIINAEQNESFVHINIQDFGVGITQEKQDEMLESDSIESQPGTKFEKGTGLGFQICKEFIKKHNGFIEIESEPGKGSKFIIKLPIKN